MAVPSATMTVQDGGLGILSPGADGVHAKVGPCQSGTANQVYLFSDPKTAVDTLGQGPLAEAVCYALMVGKKPVLAVKTPSSTAGAAGAVTATRVSTSTGTVTVAGAALDAYDVKVLITTTGTLGTGAFQYSLDGGRTYSAPITIPAGATYVIPNTGHTITFVAGGGPIYFEAADYHVFTSTAPASTSGEVQTAIQALIDSVYEFELVHVVGPASSVANASTLAVAVDSKLTTAEAGYRFCWGLVEVPDDTDSNVLTNFTATSVRIGAGVGFAWYQSYIGTRQLKRNIAWAAAARSSRVRPAEDLGRVKRGPLVSVVELLRDERKTPGLYDNGFLVGLTHIRKSGAYLAGGRLRAPLGSDFRRSANREVIDLASAVAREAGLEFLGDDVEVDPATGRISELDAKRMETFCQAALEAALLTRDAEDGKALCTSLTVTVDRTNNVLSTEKVIIRFRLVPRGYASTVEGSIGLTNPALQAAA